MEYLLNSIFSFAYNVNITHTQHRYRYISRLLTIIAVYRILTVKADVILCDIQLKPAVSQNTHISLSSVKI